MELAATTDRLLLTILNVTRQMAEQHLVGPLVAYAAATVFELIPAERCLMVLFTAEGGLDVLVARTRGGDPIADAADQVSRSILMQVQGTLAPMLVDDAQADLALQEARSVRSLRLRSVLCVPLISHGRALGAILAESRSIRGSFSEGHILPLSLFANQVVVALENARAVERLEQAVVERTSQLEQANARLARHAEELREQSIRDALTGLYNRHYFNEQLPQLFAAARRYRRPLALAVADIDNFKRINDTLLHIGGDRVLREMARLLRETLRTADSVARIGGEEFAILMPETDTLGAEQAAARLCARVAGHDWSAIAPDLRVTLSIGVTADATIEDPYELLLRADQLLYQAKHSGKNRVAAG